MTEELGADLSDARLQENADPEVSIENTLIPSEEELLGKPLYQIVDEQNPDRKITIYAYWGDKEYVEVGDTIRLTAKLEGYEGLVYSLRWQTSYETQGAWVDLQDGTGSSYTFILDDDNYTWFWRVLVDITGVTE